MIESWIERELCAGCGVCANICPQNAIEMREDAKGFLYPHVGGDCIECGKCKTICGQRIKVKEKVAEPVVYAAWSKDERLRFLSTSGGIFSELAMSVIRSDGIVSGAQYTENCLVEHGFAIDISDVERLRQSKYVQSDSKDIYIKIRKHLNEGKEVLFCGTPCQTAALQAYLKEEEKSNLYTIDFICMGVNSPKAYRAWISEIEQEQDKKVRNIWFKYKKKGWKKSPFVTRIQFSDDVWIQVDDKENKFMQAFLKNKAIIRPSCGKCQFKGIYRQSDITLGDFWGIDPSLDDDRGTSMVMVNSDKGEKLFHRIDSRIIYHKRTVEEVVRGNEHIYKSVKISEDEDQFFSNLEYLGFSGALDKLKNI